ncbi:hypothetical protein RND81_14G235600 [Saponaria officinalis]|uniref:Uncharacterized protein n=1 Tax=Saponaria officinalis TaxID=3572 RepID=A0AAW1GTR5_SAPOF
MSRNKGKAPKIQTGGYQSSDDYEMNFSQLKPSSSNSRSNTQLPTSPIETTNTFNPLSTQPNRPAFPYSQALQNQTKTQKSNEALVQNTSPCPGYFIKNSFEPLILTKYRTTPFIHEFRVNNSKIFAQGIHWFSVNISKNQRFYEFILVDSGSADIKHNRNSEGKITYSKLIINKVNSSDDWIEPFAERDFSKRFVPQTYSYQDYKNAWSRALLLEDFDHSWFVTFKSNCPQRFPIWFYQWWYLFGPVQDIYPPICTKGFETFVSQTKGELYQKPLLFHTEFKIPWIVCWSYNLRQILPQPYPLSLIREFKVKWWNKFDPIICSPDSVQSFLQGGRKLEHAVKDFNRSYTQTSPSSSKARPPRHSRPASANHSPEDRKSAMKNMVKDPIFKNELLQIIRQEKDNDVSSASSSSFSDSIHIDDDHVCGGPCSQDPFDFD